MGFADMPFGRFFHWGPITAMSIIGCITLTTLHLNDMWWPSTTLLAVLNKHCFVGLSMAALINFVYALLMGPGFLPFGWQPEDKVAADGKLQQCWTCDGFKAPRSHHCRKCNRCVKKMDHHCPWINTCVGWRNHAYFTRFLAFAVAGSAQAVVILCGAFYRGIHRYWYIYHGHYELATVHLSLSSLVMCVFSLGLAVGVVIAVGMLLVFQVRSIVRNRTGIEDWILEKARFRRDNNGNDGGDSETNAFRHPYDLGSWRRNASEVLGWTLAPPSDGDGVRWPLAAGCDAYTLTVEQIAQKADKRARTRTYRVVGRATGSWLPVWSQGWRVAAHPPCTDEARIALQTGDVVAVTRWKPHWLFGEIIKHQGADESDVPVPKKVRPRGWFPRRCVPTRYLTDDSAESGEEDASEELSVADDNSAIATKAKQN